jgi:hypothetical protein
MREHAASNDRVDYERIGQFIYSFTRICGPVEELTETALATNAPSELRERVATLARKFNHILDNAALTAESELESTLRAASEVRSEIDKWRSA